MRKIGEGGLDKGTHARGGPKKQRREKVYKSGTRASKKAKRTKGRRPIKSLLSLSEERLGGPAIAEDETFSTIRKRKERIQMESEGLPSALVGRHQPRDLSIDCAVAIEENSKMPRDLDRKKLGRGAGVSLNQRSGASKGISIKKGGER